MDTLAIIEVLVRICWLAGAVAFVLGLARMNSPATAVLILARELVGPDPEGVSTIGWAIILVGILLGGGVGLYTARGVKMTAMPQLVSLFNAVGGGAAALIAIDDYLKFANAGLVPGLQVNVATVLDIVIGSITFTGSLIASGKLMGLKITPSRPVMIPGGQLVTAGLALIVLAGAVYLWLGNLSLPVMLVILAASLVFGVTM